MFRMVCCFTVLLFLSEIVWLENVAAALTQETHTHTLMRTHTHTTHAHTTHAHTTPTHGGGALPVTRADVRGFSWL